MDQVQINDIRAFLSSHGKLAMNFTVWKYCFKSFLMSSQEFAEKFFCNTVNAQITASVGTVMVLALLELGWLLEEKIRIDASGALYPFQSNLMAI